MNVNKAIQFLLRGLLATTILFAVSAVAQDAHTTGQFQGPKANKGHVTHSTRDGKSVLTLSDDFVVPDTPDPHWQVVDSDGQVEVVGLGVGVDLSRHYRNGRVLDFDGPVDQPMLREVVDLLALASHRRPRW